MLYFFSKLILVYHRKKGESSYDLVTLIVLQVPHILLIRSGSVIGNRIKDYN